MLCPRPRRAFNSWCIDGTEDFLISTFYFYMLLRIIVNFFHFLFTSLLYFWLVLCFLELLMPGFVIYYLNLSFLFALAAVLGFAVLIIEKNKE